MSITSVMPPSPFAYNGRVLNIIFTEWGWFEAHSVYTLTSTSISSFNLRLGLAQEKKKERNPIPGLPAHSVIHSYCLSMPWARPGAPPLPRTCLPGVVYFSTCGSACGRFLGPTLDSLNQISRGGVRNPHLSSDVFTQEESQQQLMAAFIKQFLCTISLNLHRNP